MTQKPPSELTDRVEHSPEALNVKPDAPNQSLSAKIPEATRSSRRGFIARAGGFSAMLGAEIVFSRFMPTGFIPVALAETSGAVDVPGKDALTLLNDRPLNIETPAHLLDDEVTPASRMFVRNNGLPPESVDAEQWALTIDGESIPSPITFTLSELKQRFQHHRYQLTLECGGNGRSEFYPPARGNQWTTGAVSCARWTGVRLKDVLEAAKVADDAVYVGFYGADKHLSGDPQKTVISRGIPIAKALEEDTLLAWAMNDEPIPALHGYPLRLVVGGWPASVSGKWLKRLVVRNQVHDGPKMQGQSYRVPCKPVAPGAEVPDEDMCIIEQMPVKSLITYPKSGLTVQEGRKQGIRGHAWAGDRAVAEVQLSIDFGQTWQPASLTDPVNRNAWQHFHGVVTFPQAGYYEVWARAIDNAGMAQPMVLPGWNPRGYLNNACHRIAVQVA